MMIITIIIVTTKITMMIRGETGGTHPHSSPVIRRPSKLSWHLTERTVTLCLQCHTLLKDPLQYHCTLNTTHCTKHASDTWRNRVWHFLQRLPQWTLHTAHCAHCWLHTKHWKQENFHFTQDSVVECSTHLTAEQLLFYKKKCIFNTGWQDDALLHSWEHYI